MTNDAEDATGALQELLVAGGELDEAEKDRRRGRAPSRRGAFTPAPVWPDAAADLGAAGTERVALRLRLKNLEPKEEGRSSVWEIGYAATSGRVRRAKNEASEPRDLTGACSGGKFVVSRSGEVYDAVAGGPNRKFRIYS